MHSSRPHPKMHGSHAKRTEWRLRCMMSWSPLAVALLVADQQGVGLLVLSVLTDLAGLLLALVAPQTDDVVDLVEEDEWDLDDAVGLVEEEKADG